MVQLEFEILFPPHQRWWQTVHDQTSTSVERSSCAVERTLLLWFRDALRLMVMNDSRRAVRIRT